MGIKNYWLDRKKPACEKKWKRFEIFSAYGVSLIFKDDANLPSGTWIDPKEFIDLSTVSNSGGRYKEYERL